MAYVPLPCRERFAPKTSARAATGHKISSIYSVKDLGEPSSILVMMTAKFRDEIHSENAKKDTTQETATRELEISESLLQTNVATPKRTPVRIIECCSGRNAIHHSNA